MQVYQKEVKIYKIYIGQYFAKMYHMFLNFHKGNLDTITHKKAGYFSLISSCVILPHICQILSPITSSLYQKYEMKTLNEQCNNIIQNSQGNCEYCRLTFDETSKKPLQD